MPGQGTVLRDCEYKRGPAQARLWCGQGACVLAASPRGTAKSEILTKKMGGLVDDKKVGTLQAAGARTDGSKKH